MDGRNAPANGDLRPELREPAFGLEASRDIRIRGWPHAQATKYLCHAIARNPHDLLRHAQRIELAIAASDGDGVFSALLDLNIALGPNGAALRDRMRRAALQLLTPHQLEFLVRAQTSGCRASQYHPPAPSSVLTQGLTGKLDLVSRTDVVQTQTSDPITEAETQLMDGNLNAARSTLEHALAQAPERGDIASALLELYVGSQDLGSLRSLRAQIGQALPNQHDWDAVEERLSRGSYS